jgi:hypothetical protein
MILLIINVILFTRTYPLQIAYMVARVCSIFDVYYSCFVPMLFLFYNIPYVFPLIYVFTITRFHEKITKDLYLTNEASITNTVVC